VDNFDKDIDSMVRLPVKDKCQSEELFEYVFDNMTMHSLEYHKEKEILCIGTNKGSILAFSLENGID
jgi:hypothetical protein